MALLEVNGPEDLTSGPTTASSRPSTASASRVEKGQTLGIVGESGSGKSVTCLTIMGLNPKRNTITTGEALLKGEDLLTMSATRAARDPRQRHRDDLPGPDDVPEPGAQDRQAARRGGPAPPGRAKKQARADARIELLKAVGIPRAERRIDDYPHQFSGGMRQRVMIAMALINDPDLLIADEPTTALDVTTQAQILDLIEQLQDEFGSAIVMITHDLGVVAEIADDVVVMYAAEVVEQAPVDEIFKRPQHPYTWGLLGSLPRLDADVERLVQIQGQPPSLLTRRSGCRFHPRCPYVMDICQDRRPAAHCRSRGRSTIARRATSTRRRRTARPPSSSPG